MDTGGWFTEGMKFWSIEAIRAYRESINSDKITYPWGSYGDFGACLSSELDNETVARFNSLSHSQRLKVIDESYHELDDGWANELFDVVKTKYRYHLVPGLVKILSFSAFSHIQIERINGVESDYEPTNGWTNKFIISPSVWNELKQLRKPSGWYDCYPPKEASGTLELISLAQIASVLANNYGLWCRACKHAVLPGKSECRWEDKGDDPFYCGGMAAWRVGLCWQCWQNADLKIGERMEDVAHKYVAYRERTAKPPVYEHRKIIRSPTIITTDVTPRPFIIRANQRGRYSELEIEKWRAAYVALEECGVDFDFIGKLANVDITIGR